MKEEQYDDDCRCDDCIAAAQFMKQWGQDSHD